MWPCAACSPRTAPSWLQEPINISSSSNTGKLAIHRCSLSWMQGSRHPGCATDHSGSPSQLGTSPAGVSVVMPAQDISLKLHWAPVYHPTKLQQQQNRQVLLLLQQVWHSLQHRVQVLYLTCRLTRWDTKGGWCHEGSKAAEFAVCSVK